MGDDFEMEFLDLVEEAESHNGSIYSKDQNILLLKELVRRMLMWRAEIGSNGLSLDQENNFFFDVAFVLLGDKIGLLKLRKMNLSFWDKRVLSSYYNWKKNANLIADLGYSLDNPYEPYVEVFRYGGRFLDCKHGRVEIYPFIGVATFPAEDFLQRQPFWTKELGFF